MCSLARETSCELESVSVCGLLCADWQDTQNGASLVFSCNAYLLSRCICCRELRACWRVVSAKAREEPNSKQQQSNEPSNDGHSEAAMFVCISIMAMHSTYIRDHVNICICKYTCTVGESSICLSIVSPLGKRKGLSCLCVAMPSLKCV